MPELPFPVLPVVRVDRFPGGLEVYAKMFSVDESGSKRWQIGVIKLFPADMKKYRQPPFSVKELGGKG